MRNSYRSKVASLPWKYKVSGKVEGRGCRLGVMHPLSEVQTAWVFRRVGTCRLLAETRRLHGRGEGH